MTKSFAVKRVCGGKGETRQRAIIGVVGAKAVTEIDRIEFNRILILHTLSMHENPVVDNTQLVLDRRFSFETFPTKTLDATHGFV